MSYVKQQSASVSAGGDHTFNIYSSEDEVIDYIAFSSSGKFRYTIQVDGNPVFVCLCNGFETFTTPRLGLVLKSGHGNIRVLAKNLDHTALETYVNIVSSDLRAEYDRQFDSHMHNELSR